MKIGVVSSTVFACRPPSGVVGYGGLEPVAYYCAAGLAKKGHQVFFFGPDNSEVPGCHTVHFGPAGQISEHDAFNKYWPQLLPLDVIICHNWQKREYLLKQEGKLKCPILGVLHAPVNTMLTKLPPVEKPCIVCISEDQRNHFEALFSPAKARTAYNGCFEGNTLVYPVGNPSGERIQDYVKRGGKEDVLAWNETSKRFCQAKVQSSFSLLPTNLYAVEVVTSTGLTLISTPDNPIMTRDGWLQAHLLKIGDEVLQYGNDMDGGREEIRFGELPNEDSVGNSYLDESSNIVCEQHSYSVGIAEETEWKNACLLDLRGRIHYQGKVSKPYERGIDGVASESHRIIYKGKGTGIRCEAEEDSLAQKDGQKVGGIESYGSRLHSGDCGWGRLCNNQFGKEEIFAESDFGNSKYGYENSAVCGVSNTNNKVEGNAESEQFCSQKQATCLATQHKRYACWGCSEDDNSIHDGKEATGGGGLSILRIGFTKPVVEKVHGGTNEIVHVGEAGEFPSWGRVVSVKRLPTPKVVFDLKTSTGNFVANGIVVHNCDVDTYKPLNLPRSDRYLFLARFSAIKGPEEGMRVCRDAGVGLDMIGDTTITNEPDLMQRCRKMADGKQIKMVGNQTRGSCVWWHSQSKALLHPARTFREPFGLSIVESQLCESPVIAFDHGALREIVQDGITGFLVNSEAEMLQLVKDNAVASLDRKRCREWASRFNLQNMIDRYDELCQEAVSTGGW